MPPQVMTLAVEGRTDGAVLHRLLGWMGIGVDVTHGQKGKREIDRALHGYNCAARHRPWLVVRDLDHDADCAPELIQQVLPKPERLMCFRIAVREIEAWLMGDREGIAQFLQVPAKSVSGAPEQLADPKAVMVNLARRSRSRAIQEDMVPEAGFSSVVGRAYTDRIVEFARRWDPALARTRCPSLDRCIAAIDRLPA